MNYFFTSDQHLNHFNIIRFCSRPFSTVEEMNTTIIKNHNEVVKSGDTVVHAGDFTLEGHQEAKKYIDQLNGTNIFLKGSHDYWLQGQHHHEIWEKTIEGQHIVVCHYAMRVWPKSHYGSFLCYGHSHGRLESMINSWDVGVDNNRFYPVSFEQLKIIIKNQPDNPNLIKK